MITKFVTVYAGHIDLPDHGQDATPANERRYSNDQLAGVFDKTEAIAKMMDELRLRHAVAGRAPFPARRLRVPAEHPDVRGASGARHQDAEDRLRLQHRADVAPAAPRRGLRHRRHPDQGPHRVRRRPRLSHAARWRPSARRCSTRTPTANCSRSRSRSSSRRSTTSRFSHKGKHYTLPPEVPYRGYQLKELTLVPRPVHLPVECWQPVVSASPRGLDFMVKHGIKGAVGGGAATMAGGADPGLSASAANARRQGPASSART